MTTPVVFSSLPLAGRLEAIRGAPQPGSVAGSGGPARGVDSATLSAAGRELGELSTLLGRLKSAFASARQGGIAAAQGEIDEAKAQLTTYNHRNNREHGSRVSDVSPILTNASFRGSGLEVGEDYPLEVEVSRVGAQAAFYVQVPGGLLDLHAGSSVTIQIVSNLGSKTLSFASTQSISQIMSTINAFSEETGVVAEAVGVNSGFAIRSADFGSGEFVSVRSLEGQSNVSIGVSDDPLRPWSTSLSPLGSHLTPISDFGADYELTVNGTHAGAYGNNVEFGYYDVEYTRYLTGAFDIEPHTTGSFTAAILHGTYDGRWDA